MTKLVVNHDAYARLFKALLEGPNSTHELVEECGLHIITVQRLMRTLKKHKVVHISAWEPDRLGRDCTPVFTLGAGRQKPRRKMTAAERTKRYRDKKSKAAIVALKPINDLQPGV